MQVYFLIPRNLPLSCTCTDVFSTNAHIKCVYNKGQISLAMAHVGDDVRCFMYTVEVTNNNTFVDSATVEVTNNNTFVDSATVEVTNNNTFVDSAICSVTHFV